MAEMNWEEMKTQYRLIPNSTWFAFRHYLEDHKPVGDFLTAAICNDFTVAVLHADDEQRPAMKQIAQFILLETPSQSHGSIQKVKVWLANTD